MRGVRIHFGRVRLGKAEDIAGKLDYHTLHAEAYAEGGHIVLAAPFQRHELSFDTALAETGGNDHAVESRKFLANVFGVEFLRMYIYQVELVAGICGGMEQRFGNAFVCILKFHVFSDHAYGHCLRGLVHLVDEFQPAVHVGLTLEWCRGLAQHDFVEMLGVHHQRHFID